MKRLVKNYVFDRDNQEIVSADFIGLATENILLVVNVSSNEVIYNPLKNATAGVLANSTLLLDFDTTVMNSNDDLQVWIEDGVTPATNDNLDALVFLANCINERMPMLDTLDRAQVSVVNTINAAQSGTWNIGAITSLATLSSLVALQNNGPTALAPYNWASGAYHIYNGIQVTP